MIKKLLVIIILVFSGKLTDGQSLVSIVPNHSNVNQTLTTTVTGSFLCFASCTAPTINTFFMEQGANYIYPNWINVIDEDHFDANWTINQGQPIGPYDVTFTSGPWWSTSLFGGFTITDTCRISALPATGIVCQGDSVKLSYLPASSYHWKLNGTNIPGATASIYYAKTAGSYTVVTTGSTCPGTSLPFSVSLNSLPTASITPNITQHICTGQSVTFQANTGAGLTYKWKKYNSTISGATSSSYAASDAGNYSCVVTNSNGCSNTSNATKVTVALLPSVTLTKQPGSSSGKDALISSFNPNTNYGTTSELDAFAWTNGGVTANARSLFQFHLSAVPPGSTIYSAILSLYFDSTSSNGNHTQYGANSAYIQKIVSPWNESTVTWNNQPATTNISQVFLPASTTPMQDYANIDVSTLVKSMVDTPSTNYGFLVRMATEINYRALLFSSSDYPNPVRRPKLVIKYTGSTITASNGTVFCNGDSTQLQTASGTYYYQWKKNGIAISGANSYQYTAKTSGTYTVKITNNAGCSITSPGKVITVNPIPNSTITTQGPTTFCNGDSVELKAKYGATYAYLWTKNNTIISGATKNKYIAKTAGNYKVKVTSNGCTKLSSPVTVSVPCKEENSLINNNEFNVEAFPNPSSGEFNFKINKDSDEKVIVRIFDLTGRMISESVFTRIADEFSIHIERAGIYQAEVIQGGNIKVLSLVKTE